MDMTLYALLNKKIKSAVTGIASCQVVGTNLIFNFTDGTSQTMTFPSPKDGVSITNISIDTANHLIVTLSDNSTIDAGLIPTIKGGKGDKGDTGFAPTIKENEDNTEDIYKLDITTEEGTITTPNLKGEASSWSELKNKPFEKLGNDFTVSENGTLTIEYSKDNSELAKTVESIIVKNLETENIDFSDF